MLSAKDNEALTRVGRGTPMGELMRRYWQPIAAVAQLDERPTLPVRLLGEDLVLYRDAQRRLRPARSPLPASPRRSLVRHGGGVRAALPLSRLALRRHRAVPGAAVRGRRASRRPVPGQDPDHRLSGRGQGRAAVGLSRPGAGAAGAGLGPLRRPGLQADRLLRGPVQLVPGPGELDRSRPLRVAAQQLDGGPARRARAGRRATSRSRFDEFEWGFVYRRVREDSTEQDDLWTVGRVCLWPNCLYTGKFEWRVPVDDEHTLHVAWFNDPVPGSAPFVQERIPYWFGPVTDPVTGRYITSHVMNQDFVAWLGQGTHRRSHAGASGRERSRRHPVPQAHARGGGDRRARRRSEGRGAGSAEEPRLDAAAGAPGTRRPARSPWRPRGRRACSGTPGSRRRSRRRSHASGPSAREPDEWPRWSASST